MKVLITGATGFIGNNLARELAKHRDYHITALVRNYKKAENLKAFGAKLIYADTSREHTLAKISREDIDVIFHCAGYVGKDKELLYKGNVLSTENICRLALNLNVEKLVYLSSVSVVSGNNQVPLTENLPYKATNIYGESKIKAEKKVLEFRDKGLKAVILRPPMIYGESEPHMFGRLCFLIRWRLLPLIDKGKNKLHLAYVKNVVETIICSLEKEEFLEGSFFVADNEILTVGEIFNLIADQLRRPKPFEVPPYLKPILLNTPLVGKKLKFFLKDRVYSIERIKSLGFEPPYSADEALRKSVESFKR
jgi:nucleoside-diphosphate-sugar epimerase